MTAFFLFVVIVLGCIGYISLSSRIKTLEAKLKKETKEPVLESRETAPLLPATLTEKTVAPKEIAPPPKQKPKSSDLESRLGGKVFTAVGIIAVLFGVGFFLRYAFENNLISPVLRVALGFIGSLICLGLGEWLRKKYAKYGQALMGLGLGIAYLTWYATLHFYHLISSPMAFIGMILVTAIGLALSVRLNAAPLALFSQIGGFLTPALVGGTDNQYMVLFSYILILDLAILALGYFKSWREVTFIGIVGTAATFFSWFLAFHDQTPWIIPFLFVTVYFLLFAISDLMRYISKRLMMDPPDLFILVFNPFLYAIAVYNIIPHEHDLITGIWFGVIGIVYLSLLFMVQGNSEKERRYQNVLAIIGSAYLAIAIPIAFHGVTILIAWAILAVALIAWGYMMRSHLLLLCAHIVTLFPIIGMLGRFQGLEPHDAVWLNSTFLSSLGVISCLILAAWIHWMKAKKNTLNLKASEQTILISFVLVEAYILSCIAFGYEMQRSSIDHVWTIALLAAIGLIGIGVGTALRSIALRIASYITYGLLGLTFLIRFYGTSIASPVAFNARFASGLILILALGVSMWLIQRASTDRVSKDERRNAHTFLFIGMHILGLYLVSTEIAGWFRAQLIPLSVLRGDTAKISSLTAAKNASLSVAWTIYALSLLGFGIFKKSALARQFALILFSITVLKAFLYDTASLNNLYRFISFMTLGVLLLFSGYLYHRFKDRIRRFVTE